MVDFIIAFAAFVTVLGAIFAIYRSNCGSSRGRNPTRGASGRNVNSRGQPPTLPVDTSAPTSDTIRTQTVSTSRKADRREYHNNLLRTKSVIKTRSKGEKKRIARKSDIALDEHENVPVCSICLGEYEVGDTIAYSHNALCNHEFHKRCILDWLADNSACPCCRNNYLELSDEVPADEDEETGFRRDSLSSTESIYTTNETEESSGNATNETEDSNDTSREIPAGMTRTEIGRAQRELMDSIDQLATIISYSPSLVDQSSIPCRMLSTQQFVAQSLNFYDEQSRRASRVINRSFDSESNNRDDPMRDALVESAIEAIQKSSSRAQELLMEFVEGNARENSVEV